MRYLRFMILILIANIVYGQLLEQNFLVTSGIKAGIDKGDSLYRAVFYVGIPQSYDGKINFRIFDADLGGKYDNTVDESETRYLIFGKNEISWNIFSINDSLISENPLVRLSLGKDKYYNNRWRTIGSFTKDQGESRNNLVYFQLVIDGISGAGRNLYQFFVSSKENENENISGIEIQSPAMSLRLSTAKDLATQIKFIVPKYAQYINIYNFDADSARSPSTIYFETNYRKNIKIAVSRDRKIKISKIEIIKSEKGKEAALIIENNRATNNVQFWIFDDKGKIIPLFYPPVIAPKNNLPEPKITLIPLSDCNMLVLDATNSTDPDGDELSFKWFFHDGKTAEGGRIIHDFGKPGKYPVKLSVKDNSGYVANTSRLSEVIVINDPPKAIIKCPKKATPKQRLEFDGTGSIDNDGNIVDYIWEMGDGKKTTGETVSHQYSLPGKYLVTLTVKDNSSSFCNKDKTSANIWINVPPVPKLNLEKKIAAINESIKMDADGSIDSDGNIVKYVWDFGDGNTGDGIAVSHKFEKSGKYIVNLKVFDDAELKNSISSEKTIITINEPPVPLANFRKVVAANEVVIFDASNSHDSDGEIVEYLWDLGDGKIKKGEKISHKYENPGTYTVNLKVKDNTSTLNNHSELSSSIRVNYPPVADAGGNRRVNTSDVVFDGSKSYDKDDKIIDYFWDFGDNKSAHGQKVIHTYTYPGKYDVKLSVTDASKTITAVQNNIVEVIVNHPPIADAGRSQVVALNEKVKFNGGFSNDPDGKIVSYKWKVDENVILEGKSVVYQYKEPGTYQVELTVKDNADAEDIHHTTIFVNSPPVPIISPFGRIAPAEKVTFDCNPSYDIDGKIEYAEWNFGDDTPITKGLRVKHCYKEPGRYTLSLTVRDNTNAANNTTTITQMVAVNYPPKPDAGKDIITCNQTILFDGSNSTDGDGDILTYRWDFADDNYGTGIQIVHTYKNPGIYPVVLKVDDGLGLINSKQQTTIRVQVNSPPIAVAEVNRDTVCAGEPLMFDGSKSFDHEKDLLRYLWDFGDGSSSEGSNPVYSYKRGGNYLVRLKVMDDSNMPCNFSLSDILIHVIDAPVADAGENQTVCANTVVHFDGSKSTGGGRPIKSYEWEFGDTERGGGVNPTHVYTKPGLYNVRLTITVQDIGNCENISESEITVNVIAAPTASFTTKTEGCIDEPILFDASSSNAGNSKIIEYLWDFSDGVSDTGVTTSHSYSKQGKYIVNLKITTDSKQGCNHAETEKEIVINAAPKASIEVYASGEKPFKGNLYKTNVQTLLSFTGARSVDIDGYIKKYLWDFGDGNKAIGVTVPHQYKKPGTYKVNLYIEDNSQTKCNSSSANTIIQVLELPELLIGGPTAAFINEEMEFKITAKKRIKEKEQPYIWFFSDGEKLEGIKVKKAFKNAGKYQVQAKCGNVLSMAHEIIIDDIPFVKVPDKQYADLGEAITLKPIINNPLNVPIALQWDLGDGTILEKNSITYRYKQPGEYIAKLLVWYKKVDTGQAKVYQVPVKIYPAPKVSIEIQPETIFAGGARDEVIFRAKIQDYDVKLNCKWDFGDEIISYGKLVKHSYQTSGKYKVTLTAWDATRVASKKYIFTKEITVNKRDSN